MFTPNFVDIFFLSFFLSSFPLQSSFEIQRILLVGDLENRNTTTTTTTTTTTSTSDLIYLYLYHRLKVRYCTVQECFTSKKTLFRCQTLNDGWVDGCGCMAECS
ncbi:hypothetical protein BKA65DRAFT_134696 [Rhexocercosporidium sp. MPI-PUGE-AT-0058]|nr:hypothetical protein BKA65DRAFT_134696 [Rhexocercosporidium sp. MPI-PUGE-AT-0058]